MKRGGSWFPWLPREVERKAELLQRLFPRTTIQCVLVVHGEPSRELLQPGYFYRIIRSQDLAD